MTKTKSNTSSKELEMLLKDQEQRDSKDQAAATAYLNHPSWQFQSVLFQRQTRPVTPQFWEEFKLFENQKHEDWTECTPTRCVSSAEWNKAIDSLEVC